MSGDAQTHTRPGEAEGSGSGPPPNAVLFQTFTPTLLFVLLICHTDKDVIIFLKKINLSEIFTNSDVTEPLLSFPNEAFKQINNSTTKNRAWGRSVFNMIFFLIKWQLIILLREIL